MSVGLGPRLFPHVKKGFVTSFPSLVNDCPLYLTLLVAPSDTHVMNVGSDTLISLIHHYTDTTIRHEILYDLLLVSFIYNLTMDQKIGTFFYTMFLCSTHKT